MLNKFKEFYSGMLINLNQIDDQTLICCDTNVLLNIYRYSDATRNKLFEAFDKVKDNLFIPYHVGLEFNLNKKEIFYEMSHKEETIKKVINDKTKKFADNICCNVIDDKINIKSTDEKEIREEVKSKFQKGVNDFVEEWMKNELSKEFDLIKGLQSNKKLSNDLASILRGKVGPSYAQEKIDSIEEEGVDRYKYKMPPGYKDSKKDEIVYYDSIKYNKKYSDLILWKQIIDEVKKRNEKSSTIDKVIFITDDFKEDWVYNINGEDIGVRAELRKELLREAGAYLHIKNTNGFLQLVLEIDENLVQNKKEIHRDVLRDSLVDFSCILKYKNNSQYWNFKMESICTWIHEFDNELENLEDSFRFMQPQKLLFRIDVLNEKLDNAYEELDNLFDKVELSINNMVDEMPTWKNTGLEEELNDIWSKLSTLKVSLQKRSQKLLYFRQRVASSNYQL